MSKIFTIETMQGHSGSFYRYIKKLGEVNSRQEEDELVAKDLQKLKLIYTGNNEDPERAKENVVRILYAEMLGHPAEFGYIHCVNLSSHSRLSFKRTGYLGTWLCISPDNELMYLTVANIQKDLRSPNFMEVSAALDGATRFLRPELILTVVNEVTELLSHTKITVRRKAVEALHAFYIRTEGEVADLPAFRRALCDRDPSVMGAATRLLHDVIRRHPRSQQDLLGSFLSILTQVTERRLPRSYDYHRTPAPWLQISLLRLITTLVGHDAALAQQCEKTLRETMLRADNGLLIGFAIICEVVRVASTIPLLPDLVKLCSEAVARFLTSSSPNLRLAGIQALTQLARVDPDLASPHQNQVMACLEDSDDTIRRRTLVLLLAICTRDNVQPIVGGFLVFVHKATDPFLRQQTAMAIYYAAERFARSPQWFILTMNKLMAVASECVPQSSAQRMLKLIAEGQGNDAADSEFRSSCVEDYFALMGARDLTRVGTAGAGVTSSSAAAANSLPRGFNAREAAAAAQSEPLMRIAAWVMGEYGFLSKRVSRAMLLDRLCDVMDRTEETETRCWVVTAMMKLVAQEPEGCPENVEEILTRYQDSRSANLQQRCNECLALLKLPGTMRKVLPLDGCCEDVRVDASMSMLDSLVEQASAKGARPYDTKAAQRYHGLHELSAARTGAVLQTEAYAPANQWSALTSASSALGSNMVSGTAPSTLASAVGDDANAWEDRLRLQSGGTTRRWGVQNLSADVDASVAAAMAPSGAASGVPSSLMMMGSGDVAAAAMAADLSLPTTLNRWSAQGAPIATNDAWQLQGGEADAAAAGATVPSGNAPRPSVKTEKFVSAIFGNGRGKRRKHTTPSASTAAPAASPGATAVTAGRQPTQHTAPAARGASEDITRRRAAALDDLFGDAPASSPGSGSSVAATRKVTSTPGTSDAMDALFAPVSATTAAAPLQREASKGSLSLASRTTTQGTQYVVRLPTATVAHAPQLTIALTVPPGCVVADAQSNANVPVRFTSPASQDDAASTFTCVLKDVPTTSTALEVFATVRVANTSRFFKALAEAHRLTITATCGLGTSAAVEAAKVAFDVSHVLRPVASTFQTPDFGEEWVNATQEAQGQLRSAGLTVKTLQDRVAPRAALRVVEIIGSEVIAGAELVTASPGGGRGETQYVLCHFQLDENGSGASFLVHTRHRALTDVVCHTLSRAL